MKIRENNFRLKLREGAIKEYEKVMLTELNDIFMPMGFVSFDEGELVSYNCSGYSSLRQCNITEALEALDSLERTFLLVSRASEYMISPNMITLTLDTIFYDRNTHRVKIAYVPVNRENASLRENMMRFITEMTGNVKNNGRAYLDEVKVQMNENNYYIHDLINIIGDIKRTAVKELDQGECAV
ncbi:MAG: hypothetical protein IKV72_00010 [Firmicutes bacterium]|nr:hypothetical protein [Bacillota bacterium]